MIKCNESIAQKKKFPQIPLSSNREKQQEADTRNNERRWVGDHAAVLWTERTEFASQSSNKQFYGLKEIIYLYKDNSSYIIGLWILLGKEKQKVGVGFKFKEKPGFQRDINARVWSKLWREGITDKSVSQDCKEWNTDKWFHFGKIVRQEKWLEIQISLRVEVLFFYCSVKNSNKFSGRKQYPFITSLFP